MTLIAVKTPYEEVMAYFNNDAPEAMHYQEGLLNEYVKGGMAKLVISGLNNHEDCQYLVEGNKLAFRFEDKDYDLSIVTVFKNERKFEVTAISNSFELLFENYGEYSGKSMSFEQYFNVFKAESAVTIGINEVSEKRISNEWTGKQTLYARLFSLAEVFGAEIEFVTKLNDDYSLQSITANAYKEYADGVQGIGQNRTDLTFKYGKDVTTIGKTSDINDLYTAIKAYGKDGLSINDIEREWLDADGNVEYFTRKGQPRIYAPQARDRFPSTTFSSQSERYIGFDAESTEYSTAEALCGYMLSELKKNCVPKVTYDIEGDFDVNVGDTVIMEDDGYKPTLYLEVRAGETEKSLVNKRHRKMVVSNVKELASEIDASLLDRVQALIDANKTYQYSISTDNGIVFKNNTGTTTLTANVKNGVSDLTSEFNIAWFKDGVAVGTGVSITVQATEIVEKAVYRFEASRDGNVVGGYEVTVSDVSDGKGGEPGRGISGTPETTYAKSTDGTTPPTTGWTTDRHDVPAGQYLWTKTTTKYTDDTESTTLIPTLMGPKGDPTGVISSTSVPSNPYVGMLWDNTGEINGYQINTTYRWDGTEWKVHLFSADNIRADTFIGFVFQGVEFLGSKFTTTWSTPWQDTTININGTTNIEGGEYTNGYSGSGGGTSVTGSFVIDKIGNMSSTEVSVDAATQKTVTKGYELSNEGIVLTNVDEKSNTAFSGELSAQLLQRVGEVGKILWTTSGAGALMNDTDVIRPSIPLSECLNGWILEFRGYNPSGGGAQDSDYQYIHLPKHMVTYHSGKVFSPAMTGHGGTTIRKILYVTDTKITGHANNAISPSWLSCATRVFAY